MFRYWKSAIHIINSRQVEFSFFIELLDATNSLIFDIISIIEYPLGEPLMVRLR